MTKRKRVWVAVVDGKRARCFRLGGSGQLEPVPQGTFDSATLGRRTSELVSDRAGRSFASSRSGTRHAMEPPRDPRKLEKHRFAARFTAFLDAALADDQFDRCVLVAPPRSLGELRGLMSASLKERIWKEVAKDLAGLPAEALATMLTPELAQAATGLASSAA